LDAVTADRRATNADDDDESADDDDDDDRRPSREGGRCILGRMMCGADGRSARARV